MFWEDYLTEIDRRQLIDDKEKKQSSLGFNISIELFKHIGR